MARITTGKAKQPLTETLNRVTRGRERVILRHQGKDVAAIVPLEDLAALEEMEDRLDARDFRASKQQWEKEGRKTVSWNNLKAELGL